MAVPSPTTSTSIPHGVNAVINPNTLPKQYAIPGRSLRTAITSDDKQVFSTVHPVEKNDVVVVWRKPETLAHDEPHAAVFRIDFDLPINWHVTDLPKVRTSDDMLIVFRSVDGTQKFMFRASEIEAIHKWVGIWPAGSAAPQIAAPVVDQPELSLLAPTGDEPLTMSSREIAELLGDRHDSVKRTIERIVAKGIFARPPMVDVQEVGGNNRVYTTQEYRLDKRSSLIVVAQLSPEFTAKVVDRWQELEETIKQPSAPEFPIPQTFAEALQLAANQAAQIEHQKTRIVEKDAQIADMREDVDALDRIAKADDLFGVRVVAKILQMPERKFVETIQRIGWAYRQNGTKHLLGYSDKVKAGYVTSKATVYTKSDGSEGVKDTLKFTTLGIVRLAKAIKSVVTEHDIRTLLGREKGGAA